MLPMTWCGWQGCSVIETITARLCHAITRSCNVITWNYLRPTHITNPSIFFNSVMFKLWTIVRRLHEIDYLQTWSERMVLKVAKNKVSCCDDMSANDLRPKSYFQENVFWWTASWNSLTAFDLFLLVDHETRWCVKCTVPPDTNNLPFFTVWIA